MTILIIGLGNPILGDDGIGWHVAEEVSKLTTSMPDIEVDTFHLGGLSLMERLTGYKQVILIDALTTGKKPSGTISQFKLSSLIDVTSGHTSAAHDTSLRNALKVGRSMNIMLPADDDVTIVAIEAAMVYDFSEELSPQIEAAVQPAVKTVLNLITELSGKLLE